MKAEKGHILYRIDRIAGLVMKVDAVILFFLLILAGFHISNKYVWYVFGGIIVACFLCRLVLEFFVKSEDEEEFEEMVDHIIKQKLAKSKSLEIIPDDYSPLHNLTPAQEKQVMRILRDLPAHQNKPDQINLALVARYLTALDELHKINLSNKAALRIWVARTTKKDVPSSSQFNEALPNNNRKEVAAVRRELENLFSSDIPTKAAAKNGNRFLRQGK